MNIVSVCGFAVTASILSLYLRKHNAEYSMILTLGAVALVAIVAVLAATNIVDKASEIFASTRMSTEYISILIKCIGICFLTELSSDVCKDASQNALATVVLMCGRMCVLLSAIPLYTDFLDIALTLSGGTV